MAYKDLMKILLGFNKGTPRYYRPCYTLHCVPALALEG